MAAAASFTLSRAAEDHLRRRCRPQLTKEPELISILERDLAAPFVGGPHEPTPELLRIGAEEANLQALAELCRKALPRLRAARSAIDGYVRIVQSSVVDATAVYAWLDSEESVCAGIMQEAMETWPGRGRRAGFAHDLTLHVALVLHRLGLPVTRARDGLIALVAEALIRHLGKRPPEDMFLLVKRAADRAADWLRRPPEQLALLHEGLRQQIAQQVRQFRAQPR